MEASPLTKHVLQVFPPPCRGCSCSLAFLLYACCITVHVHVSRCFTVLGFFVTIAICSLHEMLEVNYARVFVKRWDTTYAPCLGVSPHVNYVIEGQYLQQDSNYAISLFQNIILIIVYLLVPMFTCSFSSTQI